MLELVGAGVVCYLVAARALSRPVPAERTPEMANAEWLGVRQTAEVTRQRALRNERNRRRAHKRAKRQARLDKLRPKAGTR